MEATLSHAWDDSSRAWGLASAMIIATLLPERVRKRGCLCAFPLGEPDHRNIAEFTDSLYNRMTPPTMVEKSDWALK